MNKKTKVPYKIICEACLGLKQTVKKVTDEQLLQCYNSIVHEISVSAPTLQPSMCFRCTDSLKKCSAFKEKVKESYRSLHSYSDKNGPKDEPEIHTDNDCQEMLAEPEVIDMPGYVDVNVKDEIKVESELDGPKTEIEDTLDNDSDVSANNDNTEADDELVKKKVKVKNSKREHNIINTIDLSYEEMLQEREKDATSESYLKAKHRCESCHLVFAYQKSFDLHMKTKHDPNIGDYSCPVCSVVIPSVDAFTAHYKRHMRRYVCSVCQKRSPDVKVIQRHYDTVHDTSVKNYKCNLCGKVFKSMDALRYHKDTHHKGRVQCESCDKTYRHRNGLINHRTAVHESQRKIICAQCGKEFRWKTSLKRHEEHHHGAKRPSNAAIPSCDSCDITFKSVSSYWRHMKSSLKHVSQDQLKFICDECGRRFANKTKLRDHIEEKHLHRKFSCHICYKPSKNRVALDQHIRNVHRGRPNNKMCHQCGKGFPTKVQLESHIRTHTGERPFICEYCPTTFSQQSNLYKHNRQVHMNVKKQAKKADENRTQDSSKPEGSSTSVLEATGLLNHPGFVM